MFSFLVAFLVGFLTCIYIPIVTYLNNVNEFSFDGAELLTGMSGPFCLATVFFWMLLFVSDKLFPGDNQCWRGKSFKVTPVHVLLLAVMFTIWLEGAFLSKGLPSLTGEAGLFQSRRRMVVDSAVWLSAFCVALAGWRRLAPKAITAVAALAVLLLAGLGDAYISRGEKIRIYADYNFVMNNLQFNTERNIIVIVADAFPTDIAAKILRNNSSLADEFEGFILMENNLAPGGQTTWAIPAILQGHIYDGGDYKQFADRAFTGTDSLMKKFPDYDLFFSSLLPRFCGIFSRGHLSGEAKVRLDLNSQIYLQLSFRFLPYPLKKWLNHKASLLHNWGTDALSPLNANVAGVYHKMASSLDKVTKKPTLHLHHYAGVHLPVQKDKNGNRINDEDQFTEQGLMQAGEWELSSLAQFMGLLKQKGLYDQTTVVLMADHGDGVESRSHHFFYPLFMVKPPARYESLSYSTAPFSSVYLPSLLQALISGTDINSFLAALPEERTIFTPPDSIRIASGQYPDVKFKTIGIDTTQVPTPLEPDRLYTLNRGVAELPLAVPSACEGFLLSGGNGADLKWGEYGKLSFKADTDLPDVDVKIQIQEWYGAYQYDPINVTITDVHSGEVLYSKNGTPGGNFVLELHGVSVKNNEFSLAISKNEKDYIVFQDITIIDTQ